MSRQRRSRFNKDDDNVKEFSRNNERDDDFNKDDYVPVHERLAEFREKYPEGFVSTVREEGEAGVSFRTIVCRNRDEANIFGTSNVAAADGYSFVAWEDVTGNKVEEFTETVSMGRALAKLGLNITRGIASAEEIESYKDNEESDDYYEDDDEDDTEDNEEKESRYSRKRRRRA